MPESEPEIVGGRYAIYDEIAAGGMASVRFGCQTGAASFARVVAVKRLHAHLTGEHEFVAMFIDEARVAARIRHPNVVPTLDVVATDREIFLIMEYVHGESLSRLLRALQPGGRPMSIRVICGIVVDVLQGLHAAHEAVNERGESLQIVHRDVSPQNLIVGLDGISRVADFGVAHAIDRLQTTAVGQIKGKCAYMAPEHVRGGAVTRAADIYSAGVVLWEALTGMRLFGGGAETQVIGEVLFAHVHPPSRHAREVSPELDAIVLRALDRDPAARFATAREMARAIEAAVPTASPLEIGDQVEALVGPTLAQRARTLARIEGGRSAGHTASHKRHLLAAFSDWHHRSQAKASPGAGEGPGEGGPGDGKARPALDLCTGSEVMAPAEATGVRPGRIVLGAALAVTLALPLLPPLMHLAGTSASAASPEVGPPAALQAAAAPGPPLPALAARAAALYPAAGGAPLQAPPAISGARPPAIVAVDALPRAPADPATAASTSATPPAPAPLPPRGTSGSRQPRRGGSR